LKYLKERRKDKDKKNYERDKKNYKMNKNMENVLSNLSFALCHTFIQDKTQMPLPIHMFELSSTEEPMLNNQNTNGE
jgi:hypothetical protein